MDPVADAAIHIHVTTPAQSILARHEPLMPGGVYDVPEPRAGCRLSMGVTREDPVGSAGRHGRSAVGIVHHGNRGRIPVDHVHGRLWIKMRCPEILHSDELQYGFAPEEQPRSVSQHIDVSLGQLVDQRIGQPAAMPQPRGVPYVVVVVAQAGQLGHPSLHALQDASRSLRIGPRPRGNEVACQHNKIDVEGVNHLNAASDAVLRRDGVAVKIGEMRNGRPGEFVAEVWHGHGSTNDRRIMPGGPIELGTNKLKNVLDTRPLAGGLM